MHLKPKKSKKYTYIIYMIAIEEVRLSVLMKILTRYNQTMSD